MYKDYCDDNKFVISEKLKKYFLDATNTDANKKEKNSNNEFNRNKKRRKNRNKKRRKK